jgi:hypothetical protein
VTGAQIACLSYLEPGGFTNARNLVRRLRRKLPHGKIIAGFWSLTEEDAFRREALQETGADLITTSLRDAANLVVTGARDDAYSLMPSTRPTIVKEEFAKNLRSRRKAQRVRQSDNEDRSSGRPNVVARRRKARTTLRPSTPSPRPAAIRFFRSCARTQRPAFRPRPWKCRSAPALCRRTDRACQRSRSNRHR